MDAMKYVDVSYFCCLWEHYRFPKGSSFRVRRSRNSLSGRVGLSVEVSSMAS